MIVDLTEGMAFHLSFNNYLYALESAVDLSQDHSDHNLEYTWASNKRGGVIIKGMTELSGMKYFILECL